MHAHIEIVMPPTEDVEKSVAEIMAQFDENADDEDLSKYAFWDRYQIGGRWSGAKMTAKLGLERVKKFNDELVGLGVTVSSMRAGKEELAPASQIPLVDTLWHERFPDSPVLQCPLFRHYEGDAMDVLPLKDAPLDMKCERVIIAGMNYSGDAIKAKYMVTDSLYNGATWQDTNWDGTLKSALDGFADKCKNYKQEWVDEHTPKDDWLVVTVDYHS